MADLTSWPAYNNYGKQRTSRNAFKPSKRN